MTKLRPMPVNSNQIKRLLRSPIGSGFFVYRNSETSVQVVEIIIAPTGEITRPDGTPLEYGVEDDPNGVESRFKWVRVDGGDPKWTSRE